MSRRRKQQGKSFQQRQAERKQHAQQQQQELDDVLDDMATKYTCSTETARDSAVADIGWSWKATGREPPHPHYLTKKPHHPPVAAL